MSQRFLQTQFGTIGLQRCTRESLEPIQRLWPLGIFNVPESPAYALVFKRGQHEMFGTKLQPPDCPADQAREEFMYNRLRIALAIERYRRRGHAGITLPCCCMRAKPEQQSECGIAVFACPAPGTPLGRDPNSEIEEKLGVGATNMVMDMFADIAAASAEAGTPLYRTIGLDVQPRLALESIMLDALIVNQEIFSLKTDIREQDPFWGTLRMTGIESMWYAPAVPAEVPE